MIETGPVTTSAIEMYVLVEGDYKPSGVYYCSNCKCVEKRPESIDNNQHGCIPLRQRPETRIRCSVCERLNYSLKEDLYCYTCFADVQADRGDTKVIPESEIPDHYLPLNVGDEFYEDMDCLMESQHDDCFERAALEEDGDGYDRSKRPKYANITEPVNQSFDAYSLIEHSVDEAYEDAFDRFGTEQFNSLQAVLNDWLTTNGITWYESTGTRVLIPWERFDKEQELSKATQNIA